MLCLIVLIQILSGGYFYFTFVAFDHSLGFALDAFAGPSPAALKAVTNRGGVGHLNDVDDNFR